MSDHHLHQAEDINKLMQQTKERLKELACINQTTAIIKAGKSIDETLQQIADIMPAAWQYPEFTCARIVFDMNEYRTKDFSASNWQLTQLFTTIDNKSGRVEVYYSKEFVTIDEGPFMFEERQLINNLAAMIAGYLNSITALRIIRSTGEHEVFGDAESLKTSHRKLLHKFLNENNYSRDLYHDLMPFKVKEILLVGTLYDAYSIEREGRFADYVLGEYRQLNLTFTPRITGASTPEEVYTQIQSKHYDLVIFFIGIEKKIPIEISQKIKEKYPYIPVFFLLNNNGDIAYYDENKPESVDRIFVWNGESSVFFAMIKNIEDKINVKNDTRVGLVRVILVVEDSAKFYSKLLPLLYKVVMEQTKSIIDDVKADELYKILRLRARPKILLANDYEEAISVIEPYKDYLQCVITDLKYKKDGQINENAGYELMNYIKNNLLDLPVCIQSSEIESSFQRSHACINKNSDNYENQIVTFINFFVGFGNFVFRDKDGQQLAVARNLKEFESYIQVISDESLIYHARRNHFSMWLMARGEINLARLLNPYKLEDFRTVVDLRKFLLLQINEFRDESQRGRLLPFDESVLVDERNVAHIGQGALGGKGRGLAFVNTLIYNFDFDTLVENINIKTPRTVIICVDVFDDFMEENNLKEFYTQSISFEELRRVFKEARLPRYLVRQLKIILKHFTKPLAVRSSSLLEDSLYQPFSGIFETYLIPNNHEDVDIRLEQCMDAIKMVYASLFSDMSRGYIEAVNYKLEEEKMGIVLQEVVGNRFKDVYYPHISGVGQSFNYYPVAYMQPEDGFSVMAVGLGRYVVEGEKAYRYCPKYPRIDINSLKDQYKDSQVHFYAVDLKKKKIDILEGEEAGLIKLDIDDAERHGALKHCASVYDIDNERIIPGLDANGPRIINFANILKFNYSPIPETVDKILEIVKEAMGTPVEIEYAIDLNKDEYGKTNFYLLQIKPLIGNASDYEIDESKIDRSHLILRSVKAMGNGVIENISDIIYIDLNHFDKSKTETMASEISQLNDIMKAEDRKYILIGPGRWGTRDKWIGVPVVWPQISNAKVIVELGFEGFPLDPSSGSHFFHNVTSMNVGYMSIPTTNSEQFIDWEKINGLEVVRRTQFFVHARSPQPLIVKMDGKNRISLIINQ